MAEFYLDTSAVGNEYQAYADVPATWGVPQDGNGKAASAASAAVPVAEVTFAAVPTSGTISVYGVNVTLTGVLSAGSTAAAATALASSINATTTATGAGVCQALLALNRFVYARVKPGGGANDSIVQIMCRIAGADLNYSGNVSARVVNTFNNSAMTSPVDFTGGVNGPYAYFFNTASVFGVAELGYGVFVGQPPSPTAMTDADIINARTRRSGANFTISYENTAAANLSIRSHSSGRSFLFDNGTVWSGDNGQFTVSIYKNSSNRDLTFAVADTGPRLAIAARSKYGFRFTGRLHASSSTAYTVSFGGAGAASGRFVGENISIEIDSASGGRLAFITSQNQAFRLFGCQVIQKGSNALCAGLVFGNTTEFLDCVIKWVGASGNIASVIPLGSSGSATNFVRFVGTQFVVDDGAYSVSSPVSGSSAAGTNNVVHVENCTGLTSPSATFPSGGARTAVHNYSFVWRDAKSGSWRYENPMLTVEWNELNASAYPTLGLVNENGVPMGCRASWESARLTLIAQEPVQVATFVGRHRLAEATRTLSVELLAPTSELPNASQLYAVFTYVDDDGVQRNKSTCAGFLAAYLNSPPALPAGIGTGSWELNGLTGFSSLKLSVTTDYPVAFDTPVSVSIYYGPPAPVGTNSLYFSPEVRIA